MPLFSVDSEKFYMGEFWTNRYVVQATDLGQASLIAAQITDIERTVHLTTVTHTKVRTSDMNPLTDVYNVQQLNSQGLREAGEHLPLFNVFRVDFNVVGGGRPSRKYLRGPVLEADCQNGMVSALARSTIETNYAAPLAALVGYVDVDGQEISGGQIYPFVGMRQLRRGAKRKLLPIIV